MFAKTGIRWISRLGLRSKFLGAALAAQALVLGVSAWNTSALVDSKVDVAIQKEGRNYGFLLNATLSSYASAGRLKEMGSFMNETLKDHDSTLSYVAVFDGKGVKIMSAGAAPDVAPIDLNRALAEAAAKAAFKKPEDSDDEGGGTLMERRLDGETLAVSFPLLLKDGEVGAAAFGLKMREFQDLRQSLVYQDLQAGLLGLLLSAALIHALTRGIHRRIAVLSKASHEVSQGVFDKPVELSGHDELASLAVAFQTMQTDIKAKIEDLSQASQLAMASEARFRGLFEKAPVPMLLVVVESFGDSVEMSNQSFASLLGWTPSDLQGDMLSWPLWHGLAPTWPLFEKGSLPLQLMNKQGAILDVDAACAEFSLLGGAKAYALSFVDDTQRNLAAHELESLNESLEARVELRNAELTESNQGLTQALETLKLAQEQLIASEKLASLGALVAGVAHEMGTPIGNALLTSSALLAQTKKFELECLGGAVLKRSALREQAERTLEACKIVGQSLEAASTLLQSFKQVAVDRKSDTRRVFNVDSVSRDTFASFDSRLRKANALTPKIEIEPLLSIDGYPGAFSQVISNFITNAIVHGFEGRHGGRIAFRALADPSDESMVIIEFEDDGNGMDEVARKRIFDPFFTTKMGRGGSGMGMNIAHTMVTAVMGGKIQVRSEQGKGAKIILRVPRVSPQKEGSHEGGA